MQQRRQPASARAQRRETSAVPCRHKAVPGQILIRLAPEALRTHVGGRRLAFARSEAALLPESIAKPLEFLENNAGLREVCPVFNEERARLARASIAGGARRRVAAMASVSEAPVNELAGINLVHVDPHKIDAALLRRLRESPAIEIAEPAPARWLAVKKSAVDPKQNLQWGLTAIGWFQARRSSAAQLVCGIIDPGVDAAHPDLAGVVDEYDHSGTSARDVIGHGTHVAGIIAAVVNNSIGISGVADCRLKVWKAFDDKPDAVDGEFYLDIDRYLQGLRAMETAKVCALNLSLGGTEKSQVEALLMKRLAKAGVAVFAAMGNDYEEGNPVEYPAAYASVFAVGAVDSSSRRAYFSNTGKHIRLVAPGVAILSTLPRRKSTWRPETNYAAWDGTSMATPYVAAAAVLLRARGKYTTPARISRRLAATAARIPSMGRKSRTNQLGAGLLNLEKALS